jgi:hypothetical protein
MASPYEDLAVAIETIIATEFAAEGIVPIHDNLHPSLGTKRVSVGIAPQYEVPQSNNMIVQETWLEVRFYDIWKKEITPETVVDPRKIAGYADRFRRAVKSARVTAGNDQVWFFDVMRVDYPNDPNGNKSRFVATVRAFGNNDGLVETSG